MKTLEWRTIDKSTWGPGPWQDEPDKRQWLDEATGLPCLAVRNESSGNWCGYVGVPADHPWYGVSYSGCRLKPQCGEVYCDHSPDSLVRVHGGLTFSDKCAETRDPSRFICHLPEPGDADDVFWFGFDCHHWNDFAPAYMALGFGRLSKQTYRTLSYVEGECRHLAQQLKHL